MAPTPERKPSILRSSSSYSSAWPLRDWSSNGASLLDPGDLARAVQREDVRHVLQVRASNWAASGDDVKLQTRTVGQRLPADVVDLFKLRALVTREIELTLLVGHRDAAGTVPLECFITKRAPDQLRIV